MHMSADASLTLPPDTLSDDPELLPLAMSAELVPFHAIDICSVAINADLNDNNYSWDQRGSPYAREYGGSPDIGAFEWQPLGGVNVIFNDGLEVTDLCR